MTSLGIDRCRFYFRTKITLDRFGRFPSFDWRDLILLGKLSLEEIVSICFETLINRANYLGTSICDASIIVHG